MKTTKYTLIITIILFFVSLSFSAYNYGPMGTTSFLIEGQSVSISAITMASSYNAGTGLCDLTSGSTITLSYPLVAGGSSSVTLQSSDSITFPVRESSTNQPLDITFTVTSITGTPYRLCTTNPFGPPSCGSCQVSSRQVSFTVGYPNTYLCTDSDSLDIYTITTSSSQTISTSQAGNDIDLFTVPLSTATDSCDSSTTVRERICSGTTLTSQVFSCSLGAYCSSGSCIQDFCSDTDNGQILTTLGTTRSGTRNPNTLVELSATDKSDDCVSTSTIREYYCQATSTGGSGRSSVDTTCPSGTTCYSGVCGSPQPYCTDSDGNTPTTLGSVASGTRNPQYGTTIATYTTLEDSCISSTLVRENICNAINAVAAYDAACPTGTTCSNGACVAATQTTAPYCYDNTAGDDLRVQGTTRNGVYDINTNQDLTVTSFVDACVNTNIVHKYYCATGSATSVSYSDIACPSGTSCSNGACIATVSSSEPFCTDSDNGQVLTIQGTTRSGTRNPTTLAEISADSNIDSCVTAASGTSTTVREYYCSGTSRTSVDTSCSSGMVCSNGACINPSSENFCTDTDSGEVITTQGTTRAGTRNSLTLAEISATEETDRCLDSDTVREYICSSNQRTSIDRNCPLGYACTNGACILASSSSENFCTDTDSSENLYTKGIVRSGTRNPTTLVEISANEQQDYCVDSRIIREFICSGTRLDSVERTCPSGYECSNGYCVSTGVTSSCTDGDGGANYRTQGIVSLDTKNTAGTILSTQLFTDTCVSDTLLREYLCSGNQQTSILTSCSTGQFCQNGACTSQRTSEICTDTDNGVSPNTKGTVEIKRSGTSISSTTDMCADTRKVKEYYCLGGVEQSTTLQCSEGTTCIDGACEKNDETNTYTIELTNGWNLFSVPVSNPKITTTCSGFGATRKPWYYDPTVKNWTRPAFLESGKGYWFRAKEACTIIVTGTSLNLSGYELKKGWNQIGVSVEKKHLDSVLASCDVVHGPWEYDTGQNKYTRADKTDTGKGYFVKVAYDCILT